MTVAFTRQLGAESGVQLNPLRDDSNIPVQDNADQVFAIAMRATRGRIDRPFKVDKSNVKRKLGAGEAIKASALNLAWVQVIEALNKGAYECVVQRLSVSGAPVIKWAVLTLSATNDVVFAASNDEPTGTFLLAIKHLECHNDGIIIEVHADEKIDASKVAQPSKLLTVRLKDASGELLHEFYGSLDSTAKDDFGASLYLPDVVESRTDAVVILTGGVAGVGAPTGTPTLPNIPYGYDSSGRERWAFTKNETTRKAQALVCFTEGSTGYQASDYQSACDKLKNTQYDYAYLSSGATESAALLGSLIDLAFQTNRQLRFDIPGYLTVDDAVDFVSQLGIEEDRSHLAHAFWTPVKSDDPTGLNPKGYFGSATLNIAYACARNAQTNAKGFAPKNFPIAGREWPLGRTGMLQTASLTDQLLNQLARAKINPVVFESYSGGGRYVFRDSLTLAKVDSSLKKLIAVADMSTSIDDAVTRYGKDVLQLPMQYATKKMSAFLSSLFEGAEASGWLVPSNSDEMGGKAWKFEVKPNEVRPYDRLDVNYWLRYDGTVRQIFVTQTLTK